MTYRYIYLILCTAGSFKNKFYVGQHTTNNLNDNYKGSGVLLKKYYKKYPEDFKKFIICYCKSQEELDQKEKEIISLCQEYKSDCLNIAKGGRNYVGINCCYRMTEDEYKTHCSNISKSLMGHKGSNPFCNMNEEQKAEWKRLASLRNKGVRKRKETIDKLKQSMENKYLGYKFLSDGYNVVFVSPEYWAEYIDIGYIFTKKKYKLSA